MSFKNFIKNEGILQVATILRLSPGAFQNFENTLAITISQKPLDDSLLVKQSLVSINGSFLLIWNSIKELLYCHVLPILWLISTLGVRAFLIHYFIEKSKNAVSKGGSFSVYLLENYLELWSICSTIQRQ